MIQLCHDVNQTRKESLQTRFRGEDTYSSLTSHIRIRIRLAAQTRTSNFCDRDLDEKISVVNKAKHYPQLASAPSNQVTPKMLAAITSPPISMDNVHKRKRYVLKNSHLNTDLLLHSSRSRSPKGDDDAPPASRRRSESPLDTRFVEIQRVSDVDPVRRAERERQLAARVAAMELEKAEKPKESKHFDAQAEFAKLTNSKSGGVYMPPARLRALREAASHDKASVEFQRLSWDALRKSLTGFVNRVNSVNIKQVVPELFGENLIRGRGLFGRSIMKAQAASLPFTPVFAALVAIINSKLPQVGELVLTRLISQFRRSFKRNDKV